MHAPFYGPQWEAFANVVRLDHGGSDEPESLLLQRALPELNNVLKSMRDALSHQSDRHHYEVASQLTNIKSTLRAITTGQLQITITGPIVGRFSPGVLVSLSFYLPPMLIIDLFDRLTHR